MDNERFTVRRKVQTQLNEMEFGRFTVTVEKARLHDDDAKIYADIRISDKKSELDTFLNSGVLRKITRISSVNGISGDGTVNVCVEN